MIRSCRFLWVVAPLIVLGFTCVRSSQGQPPPKGEALPANPIEVETRGPMHEAVAQPFDAKPGAPIPKPPPAPINEQPPDQMPDTENSRWLPGYWAWDPERQEFLWVSGVYRTPPQGRTFVPGYWAFSADGWRWVPGFWSDSRQQEIPYVPAPPAALSVAPSTPPPDDNSTYIPGVWVYRDGRFLWRPGYWNAMPAGRVWVPPYYSWTPAGYVYVDGYWDYPLEDRGLAFAPVRFNQPLPAGYVYQPDYVVNYPGILDSAYYLPGSGQFWFGNFSSPYDGRLGYQPWYNGAGRYNPAFANYGLRNGLNNPNRFAGMQRTYAGRTNGTIAGPPLTLGQQTRNNAIVTPLNQAKSNSMRMVATTPNQRAAVQQTRQLAQMRSQADAGSVANGTRTNNGRSLNLAPRTANRMTPQGLASPNNTPARGMTTPHATGPIVSNSAKLNAAPMRANSPAMTQRMATASIQQHKPAVSNAANAHIARAAPTNQARVVHAPAPAVHRAPQPAHHSAAPVHTAHASSGGHAAHGHK